MEKFTVPNMRFSKEIRQLIRSAHITNLPIGLHEIKQIIERSGWEIYSYNVASDIIEQYHLQEMADRNDAFSARIGNRFIIFYSDNISQLDFPCILAHEIGHIVLEHLSDIDDIYAKERDCNCFAEELLNYTPLKFGVWAGAVIALSIIIVGSTYFIPKHNHFVIKD